MSSTPSRSFAAAVGDAALLVSAAPSTRADGFGEGRTLNGHTSPASVDGSPTSTSVPIELQGALNWVTPIANDRIQRVTDIGGGVFYTGRKDLAAGLQLLVRRFAVVPEVNVSGSTVLTQFGLRYYF